jgi:hypothetical protein
VDQIAATVPTAGRPEHGAVIWGVRRSWTGAGMILLGIAGFTYVIRTALRSSARPRAH